MIRITNPDVQSFEQEHIDVIRRTAPECTLFLKKDDTTLPIVVGKVALYGSGARKTIKGGTGSGDVNVRRFVTIEEGLENAGFTITSKEWLDAYDQLLADSRVKFVDRIKKEAVELGINPVMHGMGKPMPEPEYEFPLNAEGDLAIYVLSRISGEGSDRSEEPGDINLTGAEIRDILDCQKRYAKFVLVLNVGGMVNLEPVMEVDNILLLSQLGTPIGDVLADILLGKSYPSGKLTMTWAPLDQYPSTEGFGNLDDTIYHEGIYVGYRYFDSMGIEPAFPFGFGLSYTNFILKTVDVVADENNVCVKVEVKNIGSHKGKEVVQLYVSAPAGRLDKPYQELRAFSKTKELAPGECETLSLSFITADMVSYDEEAAAYILEKGNYVLRVGNSSVDTDVCGILVLDRTVTVKQCKNVCISEDVPNVIPVSGIKLDENPDVRICKLYAEKFQTQVVQYRSDNQASEIKEKYSLADVRNGKVTLDEFIASLSNKFLAYLCIGLYEDKAGLGSMVGAAAKSVAGAAGETTERLLELDVPTVVMADGPAGIRVCTQYKIVKGTVKSMDNPLAGMMEFLGPEELKKMAEMAPKPTEEEIAAQVYYMYCVAIPIGTAIAQSFNTVLCEEIGDVVGREMEMFGINLWLAPAINIQRSPLCGRNFEYYSEDPLVSGLIGAGITNGVQTHKGCGVTIKHYALNNQETNRMASNSIASERTIRELYLKNFEICIRESSPYTIMSSYNLVNGEHVNNSKDLLTYVLRDEWGYDGVVMTDWYAANDLMANVDGRKNKHIAGIPAGCIHAGNDITMPGMAGDLNNIMEALEDRNVTYPITRGDLQATARRVVELVLKLAN